MSGRKSSEVNRMLARGVQARKDGLGNYKNNFRNAINILYKNNEDMDNCYQEMGELKIDLLAESYDMFSTECSEIESRFAALKERIQAKNYHQDAERYLSKAQTIDTEYQAADKKGERIRKAIQGKNWYLDKEYADANRLVSEYEKLGEKKNRLLKSVNQKAKQSSAEVSSACNCLEEMRQVIISVQKINERTKQMVELRNKASEARTFLQESMESIDVELANKFMKKEYQELQQEVHNVSVLSDEQIVEQMEGMSEKINIYRNHLDICYSEYLEKKGNAQLSLSENERLLSIDTNYFFDAIDLNKNKEQGATKIATLDYLTEYSDKSSMVQEIRNGLKKARDLIDDEQFDDAKELSEQVHERIYLAIEYAALLQEHMITNLKIAADLRTVMRELGFEAGAYKINGNIKNGWKIEGSNSGGEVIEFTKVFVNDDGEVDINLDDHHTLASCSTALGDIQKKMSEKGMYIESFTVEETGGKICNRHEKEQSSHTPKRKSIQQREKGRK